MRRGLEGGGFEAHPSIMFGPGKRQPTTGIVTGTPPGLTPTHFGASGIRPFLGGSRLVGQPLTIGRPAPFLQVLPPALEAPQFPGYLPEPPETGAVTPLPGGMGTRNGRMKEAKVGRRRFMLNR